MSNWELIFVLGNVAAVVMVTGGMTDLADIKWHADDPREMGRLRHRGKTLLLVGVIALVGMYVLVAPQCRAGL